MTTILSAFIISFSLSLALTPFARWFGIRSGATDKPGDRKVHTRVIPRCGGVVIVLCFFLTLLAATFLRTRVSDLVVWDQKTIFGALGALVVFGVGLYDDFHRLGPRIKFSLQIVAASLAFHGGLRIEMFNVGGIGIQFGALSWFVTVFWFVLIINAMNLIDGLDGLASGVAFFACVVMVILSLMQANYISALEFAALGGTLLGFLRYNFNPASIFLGDGGSYFIGYAIAALAIQGSIKSQVGATLLIPLLALGVPIFDTLLSPVRRFIRGRRMFHPDREHIHHKMLTLGFSSHRAVITIYGISAFLCVFSIMVVHARHEWVGLMLSVLGAGTFFFVRRLGYLEYFAVDKIYGWLQDVTDVAGFSTERRSFLSLQIEMSRSKNMDELWKNSCQAFEKLRFDRGEFHIQSGSVEKSGTFLPFPLNSAQQSERRKGGGNGHGDSTAPVTPQTQKKDPAVWIWTRGPYRRASDISSGCLLKVEVPLGNGNGATPALFLIKDIHREPLQPYTLRRVEHLRRTLTEAMERLQQRERAKSFAGARQAEAGATRSLMHAMAGFTAWRGKNPGLKYPLEGSINRRMDLLSVFSLLLHRDKR